VDPTRLELVTSAMRRQRYILLEVSRLCKIPAIERILARILFPSFQDIGLGCCTVAAHRALAETTI
jgi:hypothetical protein